MGDYAVRIAKRSRRLTNEPHGHPSVYVELREMGELVEQHVHDILDAFIATDKDAAVAVAERDDATDRLYRNVFAEQLSGLAEGPEHALRAQYLLNIAHTHSSGSPIALPMSPRTSCSWRPATSSSWTDTGAEI
jgi:phosphate transport system protein